MPRFVARIGFAVLASAGAWWLAAAPVSAQSFSTQIIDAKSNLFGAGRSGTAPDPGGNGGGILPPVFSLTAGSGRVLTFMSVTGSASYNNDVGDPNRGQFNGPDGGFVNYPPANTDGFNTAINSYDGISGLQLIETATANRRVMFLAGVFLDDSVPAGTAPPRLDFSSTALGTGFPSLSPLLNQTFFIGDGLTATGSGLQQQFSVPDAATRLFLGFIDGADFQGDPTFYGNNDGSFVATFSVVPEPTTLALGIAILPLGLLAARRLRRPRCECEAGW
ncbi:MAG: hypothetical protein KGR24_10165 [Planctomycetes bacterium]|nr:hypothetical protein [Planctomycetota bacterium]